MKLLQPEKVKLTGRRKRVFSRHAHSKVPKIHAILEIVRRIQSPEIIETKREK